MLAEVSPSSSPLPAPGSLTSTPTRAGLYPGGGGKAHAFQEHIFKKPTFCDVCNHMIVGKPCPCSPAAGPRISGKPDERGAPESRSLWTDSETVWQRGGLFGIVWRNTGLPRWH